MSTNDVQKTTQAQKVDQQKSSFFNSSLLPAGILLVLALVYLLIPSDSSNSDPQPISERTSNHFVELHETEGYVDVVYTTSDNVVLEVLEAVELKPFMWGLTPQERGDTVIEWVEAFNTALVFSSAEDPDLQEAQLYKFGSLIRGAADAGDTVAQEVLGEYQVAYWDDLEAIGAGNYDDASLVRAVVALDALGFHEDANDFALEIIEAREAAAVQAPAPEVVESAPAITSSGSAFNRTVDAGPTLATSPLVVSESRSINGLAYSPYTWVLLSQYLVRLYQNVDTNDSFYVSDIYANQIDLFDHQIHVSMIEIRRVRHDNGQESYFTLGVLSQSVNDLKVGQKMSLNSLQTLAQRVFEPDKN